MIEFITKGNYEIDKNGIFVCRSHHDITTRFKDSEQNELFKTEDTSWWFQYRAQVIAQIFMKYCNTNGVTFDIGGGNGYTSKSLKQISGGIIGIIEPSYGACLNAKKRNMECVVCDTIDEYSPKCSIDQTMLLDVLEHIEKPDKFLANVHNVMMDNGYIIITVPAFMSLWSSEDVYARHFKRYKKKELRKEMENAGFEVLYISYFMSFLYLPVLLVRVWGEKLRIIKKSQNRTDEERKKIIERQFKSKGRIVNVVLTFLEKYEMKKIMREKNLKFGSSLLAIGIKR